MRQILQAKMRQMPQKAQMRRRQMRQRAQMHRNQIKSESNIAVLRPTCSKLALMLLCLFVAFTVACGLVIVSEIANAQEANAQEQGGQESQGSQEGQIEQEGQEEGQEEQEAYTGDTSTASTADTTLEDSLEDSVADEEENIAIEGLINGGSLLDGLEVTFEGEVVGNDIDAGDGYKWVNLYDNGSTISVYMSTSDASDIIHRGSFGTQGDTLRVVGIFHIDCPDHEGDVDVHATNVEIVSRGYDIVYDISYNKLKVAIISLIIAGILALLYWRLRERLR